MPIHAAMAYDVSKRPAEWTSARSRVEVRRALMLVASIVAVGALFAFLGAIGARWFAYLPLLGSFLVLRRSGNSQADLAARWVRGARSEEAVGATLETLRTDGFTVLHDVAQIYEGNVDHVVSGPTGVFLVETKHRSYLAAHLVKAKRQAARLHDQLGVWVTPVICLEQRTYGPRHVNGVWIVGRRELVACIRSQRNRTLPFERLAAWADTL